MVESWTLTMKPGFLHAWTALPSESVVTIQQSLETLLQDPQPDGEKRISLPGDDENRMRMAIGEHHIYYTLDAPYINLLALHQASEEPSPISQTQDKRPTPEAIPHWPEVTPSVPDVSEWLRPLEERPAARLTRAINEETLKRLAIPKHFHKQLKGIDTRDALLECSGVPDEYLLKIDDALGNVRPITSGPDQIVNEVKDLLKYREGELRGFLLKLNPEQQKFATWRMDSTGATLLKGGPGTGKSTVALYRTWKMFHAFREQGVFRPKILFTTYTNALVNFSKQLLHALMGDNDEYVDVRTADSLVMNIVMSRYQNRPDMADRPTLMACLEEAIERTEFEGSKMQKKAQETAIARLNSDYLLEEIQRIIEARRLYQLDDYLKAKRPGRKLGFNKIQRKAVWAVHKSLQVVLAERRLFTWQQLRARAAELVEKGHGPEQYDAVLVDEAQDLDASVLQLIAELCKTPANIFVTADANQSIYGGGFRWTHVHDDLNFRGRTGVLRANHRSTLEIGEAAHSYLAWGAIEGELEERTYVSHGPRPAVRAVEEVEHETQLLYRFFKGAAKDLRFGLGSCAVLCPTRKAGERIAQRLEHLGTTATFMTGQTLNLGAPGIKVMTLKTAKGLEFPLVGIAGFLDSEYPILRDTLGEEERDEILTQERRTMFVGMTRAMRALLVVIPSSTTSPLLEGFEDEHWNLSR
ncbi:MAG TPA: DNA helicase UvrD [Myxococcales bacterium]|nr:DNA helicase UvrD [Deltaproteobacteria bacterium]MBU54421.1 DNA helicase UvrD [Deltaproteobacteria bacterium]HAA57422.1 DNA helicase UvrD [Myxococcales bacterium]|tara:strand:- start:4216 stop:6306 length:2091 start_codon:yes stop_codon:yes gene_type:complete